MAEHLRLNTDSECELCLEHECWWGCFMNPPGAVSSCSCGTHGPTTNQGETQHGGNLRANSYSFSLLGYKVKMYSEKAPTSGKPTSVLHPEKK